MNAVEVKNLKKFFGRAQAVAGVNFSIAEKEIFALIGPNGAGKSTTLRMLATILQPSGGSAAVFGRDVQRESGAVRRLISYLPEEAGAYKSLTGRQYLSFMAELYADSLPQVKEYVAFASDIAGLGPRLSDKIRTYSKGMTRKLLLARAVMTRPKLAILDEPTSGLDVINALEIRGIIRRLAREGMSVLLSSHNMLEIDFLSDRVGIIHEGRIYEIGTPEALKAKYGARNLEEVFHKIVERR